MCKGHETQLSVHKHFPFFVTIFTSHFHGDSRIQPPCLLPYHPGTSYDLVLINHPMASIVKLTLYLSYFCHPPGSLVVILSVPPIWLFLIQFPVTPITSIVFSGLQISLPFCVVDGTTSTSPTFGPVRLGVGSEGHVFLRRKHSPSIISFISHISPHA